MKHRNKYIKYTATPVMYLLGAGFCMASLLGGCTEEMEVSPVVPDGTPVELIAEIAGTVQTKAAIPENNYDRSAFVAGDKILLVKSYGESTAKTDYTFSADAATWTPPSANNPITLQAGATYQAVYPSVSDGTARIALSAHQQLSAHGRFDHRVPQCQLRQGHLEERLVWPGKFQVSVCHQGCLGHHPQYHRL